MLAQLVRLSFFFFYLTRQDVFYNEIPANQRWTISSLICVHH